MRIMEWRPLCRFLLPDMYIVWQAVAVAIIVIVALVYPLRKISKMQVVNSLKA